MMENIIAKIEKNTRKVYLSKSVIGNDGENLQEKLVFSFDSFVDGTARLELNRNNTQSYIMLTKVDNTYELPIKSIITKVGKLDLQLVITEGTNENEIPVFKSNVFFVIVNPSINAEIEEEEDYPQWIDVANTKLNLIDEALEDVNSAIDEVENLDINATQTSTGATITITKKDSTQESVSILNGTNGRDGQDGITPTIGNNGNWYLGETDTGKPSRGIQGQPGQNGNNGQDAKINGVNTLSIVAGQNITLSQSGNELEISSTGGSGGTSDYSDLTNKPSINNVTLSGNKSLSDLGIQSIIDSTHKLDADLVDDTNSTNKFVSTSDKTNWDSKISRTDYPDGTSGGVVRMSTDYKTAVDTGYLRTRTVLYQDYQTMNDNAFVGKGTLENVIAGKQLVNQTYIDNLIGNINTILATLTTPSDGGGN